MSLKLSTLFFDAYLLPDLKKHSHHTYNLFVQDYTDFRMAADAVKAGIVAGHQAVHNGVELNSLPKVNGCGFDVVEQGIGGGKAVPGIGIGDTVL